MKTDAPKTIKSQESGYAKRSPVADGVAAASSLLAMGASIWTYIESKVYKNMSSLGMFDDMKPKRKDIAKNILTEAEQGTTTRHTAFHLIDDLIEANEAEARQRFKTIGVSNIVDRWKLLRRHQKIEALVISAAAGGIALGSVLPFARDIMKSDEREAPPQPDVYTGKIREQREVTNAAER